MSLLKRLADAIRISPGFHVSGMNGAIEIEDIANRSRQFVPIAAAAVRVELKALGDDGTQQVMLSTECQTYAVSVPLRASDADAWANAVSKEVRRAIGGRGRGGLAWVALLLAFFLVLWFITGVLGALGGMRPSAGPLGASVPAVPVPSANASGLPANVDLDAYFQRAVAQAEDDLAADHAARAAAGIGAEVCDAPDAPPAGVPSASDPAMGEAPPIAGFSGEDAK